MKIKTVRNCDAKRSAKQGSSLVMVMIVSAVAVALLAAITTAVLSANALSRDNANAQQAYFTARSAVNATIAKLNDGTDTGITDYVRNTLLAGGESPQATGSFAAGNTYTVTMRKNSPTNLTITGIGTYKGTSRKVTAILQQLGVFKNVVCSDLGGMSSSGITVTGDTASITAKNDITIKGDLKNFDTIRSLCGSVNITSTGNSDVSINRIYSVNSTNLNGSTKSRITVNNTVECDSLTTAFCTLNGLLRYYNNYGGTSSTFPVQSNITKLKTALKAADSMDIKEIQPVLNMYGCTSQNVVLTGGNSINSSGIVNDAIYQLLSSKSNINIDTSSHDIWLTFSTNNINGINLTVKGPNKLFIYLSQGNNMTLAENSTIRMADSGQKCNTFILGAQNTKLTIDSTTVDAYIYMPNGSDVTTKNAATINGNVIAQNVSLSENTTINYKYPDISGTPLENIAVSSYSSDSSWTFSRWS